MFYEQSQEVRGIFGFGVVVGCEVLYVVFAVYSGMSIVDVGFDFGFGFGFDFGLGLGLGLGFGLELGFGFGLG